MEHAAPQVGAGADDRDLVLAFQDGCRDAYAAIYRRHESRVRNVCTRILRQPDDAQEAVQETFLRAYQALGRFNGRYELGAWLGRIATNVCVDQLRARSRHGTLALIPLIDQAIPDKAAPPEEVVAGADPRIDQAIDGIRPLHARALKLRAVHGLSHREMAGRLSMSPDQVKALLHRARRSFKRAFERAGNWAAAPLIGIRHVVSRARQTAAGNDSLALIAGPAGPAVAERAITGVLVAAIVLVGAADAPSVRPGASEPPRVAPNIPVEDGVIPPDGIMSGAMRAELTTDAGPLELSLPEVSLVAHIGPAVDGSASAGPAQDDGPTGERGEEPPVIPMPPTSSEADQIVDQIEETVEQIGDFLGD